MSSDRTEDQPDAATSLIEEIKALRDSTEELYILLEHIWRNRDDLRLKASVVLTDGSREAIEETICCYECDAGVVHGLAQALHNGWIDIQCDESQRISNFAGWCPDCQREHEQEERRLNEGCNVSQPQTAADPAPEQGEQTSTARSAHERQQKEDLPIAPPAGTDSATDPEVI